MPRATRTRRSFRSSSRPLRPFEWGGFSREGSLGVGATDCSWIIDPVAVQLLHEPTLMRLLINYVFNIAAPADPEIGAAGIIRWSGDPDVVTAPGDCPEPLDDANLDWAWFTYLPFAGTGTAEVLTPGTPVVDIGSMRKLTNSEGLLLIVQAPPNVAMEFAIGVRYLFKQ